MAEALRIPCEVALASNIVDGQFDAIVVVTDSIEKLQGTLQTLQPPISKQKEIDNAVEKDVSLVQTDLPCKRLVYSPTGPLNRDYDDVRRFMDAAVKGIERALKAGAKSILLVRPHDDTFPLADHVTILGALSALYVPYEVRQDVPDRKSKAKKLSYFANHPNMDPHFLKTTTAIESGRGVYRDIGGSDPENMAAPKVEAYVRNLFNGTNIKVDVINDHAVFEKEYPCLAAVNRAANVVPRHQGRLIFLEYEGEGPIEKTLFLVGKGITYDTGGCDIKAGGIMAGMHRDKCGAAFVAGFFQVLSLLKPRGIKVVGGMSMVRNSVGEEAYVADEIIISRAGKRVRVGNTDAEGRMVMADVLCKFKELAVDAVNPHLFTIATLTGHAVRAVGPSYSLVMDNGPARKQRFSHHLQEAGDVIGDPFEISTIRREDHDFHRGKSEYEDILQCNNLPSSQTARGHQSPAAFLIQTSGMECHGIDSAKPLAYSHIDIAGSSGPFPGQPTGAPIASFVQLFLTGRV